jgi:hypothetical protein
VCATLRHYVPFDPIYYFPHAAITVIAIRGGVYTFSFDWCTRWNAKREHVIPTGAVVCCSLHKLHTMHTCTAIQFFVRDDSSNDTFFFLSSNVGLVAPQECLRTGYHERPRFSYILAVCLNPCLLNENINCTAIAADYLSRKISIRTAMGLGLREAVECCTPGTLVVHCVHPRFTASASVLSINKLERLVFLKPCRQLLPPPTQPLPFPFHSTFTAHSLVLPFNLHAFRHSPPAMQSMDANDPAAHGSPAISVPQPHATTSSGLTLRPPSPPLPS